MMLIEIFTDYVVNRKSLKEYVEVRRRINERGEFNDRTLIRVEDDLLRLKHEDPETYEAMYATLEEIMCRDEGHLVEYPINFIKQILRIYEGGVPAKKVLQSYREVLEHHFQDAC